MDPNSAHQVWGEWTFIVHAGGRRVRKGDVEYNAAKWLRLRFGTASAIQVTRTLDGWKIMARTELADAKSPAFVRKIEERFLHQFVRQGFGLLAWSEVSVRLLADPDSRNQWVSIPLLDLRGGDGSLYS